MKKFIEKFKKIYATSIGGGISWNMIAFGFMAVSGILYNSIILDVYGKEVTGFFNLAFAYYASIAQLAVCGIHFSVLKYISEFHEDKEKVAKIFGSSMISTALVSFGVVAVSFAILYLISHFVHAELIGYLYFVIPALFFFSLNKVALNYLNGLSRMKEYAVFQSLRSVFIIVSIIIMVAFKVQGRYLALCFLISELILFAVLAIYAIKTHYIELKADKYWMKEHIRYGFKVMPGNLVLELNARMDVMILGFFTSEGIVGIYSYMLRFAEGFYQLLVVVRRNINPDIARFSSKKDFDAMENLKKSLMKYSKYLVPICACLITGGAVVVVWILGKTDTLAAFFPFVIVMASITLTSKYIIFGNTLNQSGFPSQEAHLNIATLGTNILINIALIPFLGMYGAAIGTAVSYFVFSVILYKSVKKRLNYKI